MSFNEARAAGALKLDTTDQGVPTVRNMVLAMDGQTIDGVVVNTVSEGVNDEGGSRTSPTPVFSKLGLIDQVMHTVASPPMAFLLFVIGLALLIFEFFTAGVGIAGSGRCGVRLLRVLRPGRTARPRLGRRAARAGHAGLRHRRAGRHSQNLDRRRHRVVHHRRLGTCSRRCRQRRYDWRGSRCWWASAVIMLTFIVGMPSMVRTRFATPTIGREWMIGELGRRSRPSIPTVW